MGIGRSQCHLSEIYGQDSAYNTTSTPEGYYWLEPDLTEQTDTPYITVFDGVVSGVHDIGGPEAATTPTVTSGWITPDGDQYRRISGLGIATLCSMNNVTTGSLLFSMWVQAVANVSGTEDILLSATPSVSIHFLASFFDRFQIGGSIAIFRTDIADVLGHYPLPNLYSNGLDGGQGTDSSWEKTTDNYHVGVALNKSPDMSNWIDLYIDGNLVAGELANTSTANVIVSATTGVSLWGNVPAPLGDGSSYLPVTAKAVNRDVSVHKTRSLLIRKYATNQLDTVHQIMRDHYRDPDNIPTSAL